jgi:hypothetical protein
MRKRTSGFRSIWHWTLICVLLVWGLTVNCWGQQAEWESCQREDLPATRALVGLEILSSIPCPPGVGGECFRQGPRWNLFTQDNAEPCSHLQNLPGSCRGWQGEPKVCIVASTWYGPPRYPFPFIHSSNPPVISYVKRRMGNSGGPITVSGGLNPLKVNQKVQRARDFGSNVFFQASSVTISLQPNSNGPGGRAIITKSVNHYWEFTYKDRSKTIIEAIMSPMDGTYNGNHATGDCSFLIKQQNVGTDGKVTNFQDKTGVDKWNAVYDPLKKEMVLFLPGAHDMNEWVLH